MVRQTGARTTGAERTMVSGMARVNGLEIAYDTFGQAGDPPVVLVMGLGAQRISWPDEFCADLVTAGRFVVRFDNRDVGESTHLHQLGEPSVLDLVLRRAPYQLDDMADDTVGLFDALGLSDVHLVGVSLGGFIAQTVAIRHPSRVRTLTLMMTSTGNWRVGRSDPRVVLGLVQARRRPASSREEAVERAVQAYRAICSPGYPFDEQRFRRVVGLAYERGYDPAVTGANWRRRRRRPTAPSSSAG